MKTVSIGQGVPHRAGQDRVIDVTAFPSTNCRKLAIHGTDNSVGQLRISKFGQRKKCVVSNNLILAKSLSRYYTNHLCLIGKSLQKYFLNSYENMVPHESELHHSKKKTTYTNKVENPPYLASIQFGAFHSGIWP